MPARRIQYVREDSVFVVYAESPDCIRPQELSERLAAQYGNHFRVSLRRNVYVIYVDQQAVKQGRNRNHVHADDDEDGDLTPGGDDEGIDLKLRKLQDYKQRYMDVELAKSALKARDG